MSQINGRYSSRQNPKETIYADLSKVAYDQHALNVRTYSSTKVSSKVAEANTNKAIIACTAHGLMNGEFIRFTSGPYNGFEFQVVSATANEIVLASTLQVAITTGVTFDIMRPITMTVGPDGVTSVSIVFNTLVDVLDNGLIDLSVTPIPASANPPLELVASAASTLKSVDIIEDVGEFMELLIGGVGVETHYMTLPLGGGTIEELSIPGGSRVSIRALKNVAINIGNMAMNFKG